MKPEFQKLLDLTLIDGFLSEKERNVLRKKGEDSGMSSDEVDIIIDARLFEINRDKKTDKVVDKTKCPKCGEQLTGASVVCPSCSFITNSDGSETYNFTPDPEKFLISEERRLTTLHSDMLDLNQFAFNIKTATPEGFGKVIKSGLLILFSSGIYILYKKLLKKETLFDRYDKATTSAFSGFYLLRYDMSKKYKNSKQVLDEVNGIASDLNLLRKKRNMQATITGLLTFAVIGAVVFWAMQMPKAGMAGLTEESPYNKTQRHIKMGRISEAKKSLLLMDDGRLRDESFVEIRQMEIDSLADAHDYTGAIKLAATIADESTFDNKRENAVKDIVRKQVKYLCDEHRYAEARKAAKVTDYSEASYLENTINLSESIYEGDKKTKK